MIPYINLDSTTKLIEFNNNMPVNPRQNEREEEFISRCIGEEVSAGYETEQAAAICYSYWRKDKMSKLSGQDKIIETLKFNRDFRGINLFADEGLEGACWEGYVAIGMKELDGRMVPNCVPEGENMEAVQPTIDSSYAGEPMDDKKKEKMEITPPNINVFGYHTRHFGMCPTAQELFKHLITMPMEEYDTRGMIRSAAQIADNVFRKEEEVVKAGVASQHDYEEVALLVGDFRDLMIEIDDEVGMQHDTSFMINHVDVVNDLLK